MKRACDRTETDATAYDSLLQSAPEVTDSQSTEINCAGESGNNTENLTDGNIPDPSNSSGSVTDNHTPDNSTTILTHGKSTGNTPESPIMYSSTPSSITQGIISRCSTHNITPRNTTSIQGIPFLRCFSGNQNVSEKLASLVNLDSTLETLPLPVPPLHHYRSWEFVRDDGSDIGSSHSAGLMVYTFRPR